MGTQLRPKRGTAHQFSVHVYCGQTTGWMKTPLGTEIDLGPGHIVLDGIPALRESRTAAPHLFGPCLLWPRAHVSATVELLLLWPNGAECIKMPLDMEVGLSPGEFVLDGAQPPPQKGGQPPPQF